MVLSFSLVQSGNATAIQVHLDEEGLATLLRKIDSARQHGHVHLCAPSCGGVGADRLDEKTPSGDAAIGEIIVDWEGEPKQPAK